MTHSQISPLNTRPFLWLIASVFAVALGYGIVLPILPFFLASLPADSDRFSVASHVGMITGVYAFAIFLFAPLQGRPSDKVAATQDSGLVNVLLTFLKAFGLCGFEAELPWHGQQILGLGPNRCDQMDLKTA